MSALQDYYNQIESSLRAAKSNLFNNAVGVYADAEGYLSGKKADFYRSFSPEEQNRLKLQQLKDMQIRASQEALDTQNPAYQEEEARLARQREKDAYIAAQQEAVDSQNLALRKLQEIQGLSQPSVVDETPRRDFYIYPEDEARKAEIQRQLQSGTQNPYGMGTTNFAGGKSPAGNIAYVSPVISEYLNQFGQPTSQPIGPPVPKGFQYQQPSINAPIQTPITTQPSVNLRPSTPQAIQPESNKPDILAGWTPSQAQESISEETLASLTPQERYAVEQGYVPPRAEVVQRVQSTQPQVAPAKVVQTSPAVNSAFEEMLKSAPPELQPMFRALKASSDQRTIARKGMAQQAIQFVEEQRQAKHESIDAGEKIAADSGRLGYAAVQHAIRRERAMTDKNAEMLNAELSVQGMEPTAASEFLKDARNRISEKYKEDIVPFSQSEQYKNARTIAQEKDTGSQGQMIDLLYNTVNTINDLTAPKDMSPEDQDAYLRREKASRIKTFLTQLVNSAKGSSDAEQSTEVLRRAFDIFTYPEIQALKNQGLLNPSGILSYLSSREGKNVFDKIANSMTANPDAYLTKVKEIHDDLAKTYNGRMIRQVFVPTSPKIAKQDFGIVERRLFQAKSITSAGPDVAVQVVRPTIVPTATTAVPAISRAQAAAQILQQRAAQKAAQQQ